MKSSTKPIRANVARVLEAMRAAANRRELGAQDWLRLAEKNTPAAKELADAFTSIGVANRVALGLWLKRHAGSRAGELTLTGRHSPGRKAWLYRVEAARDAIQDRAKVAAALAASEAAKKARAEVFREARLTRRGARRALRECGERCGGADVARQVLREAGGVSRLAELPQEKFSAVIAAAKDAKAPERMPPDVLTATATFEREAVPAPMVEPASAEPDATPREKELLRRMRAVNPHATLEILRQIEAARGSQIPTRIAGVIDVEDFPGYSGPRSPPQVMHALNRPDPFTTPRPAGYGWDVFSLFKR